MILRPYSASYKCGRDLVAHGCPLDFLERLPRNSPAHQKRLYVREVGGYAESRIFDRGAGAIGWIIAIVIGTDLSPGIVIDDWCVHPPFPAQIIWDYDPRDVIPVRDHPAYERLFKSRLPAVLNERRLLTRGHPVAGLLAGLAQEPFKPNVLGQTIHACFVVTDDTGLTVKKQISLAVDGRPGQYQAAARGSKTASAEKGVVFQK